MLEGCVGVLVVRRHNCAVSYVAEKGNESQCSTHKVFTFETRCFSWSAFISKCGYRQPSQPRCVWVRACVFVSARAYLRPCVRPRIPVALPDVGVFWLYFITAGSGTPTLIREICKARQKQISAWHISTKLHQTISSRLPTQRTESRCIIWLVGETEGRLWDRDSCVECRPLRACARATGNCTWSDILRTFWRFLPGQTTFCYLAFITHEIADRMNETA